MANKKIARIAGLFYLTVAITAIVSLMYIPSKLIIWNDASLTFENIKTHQLLLKIGILSDIVLYLSFAFLAITLYKLLETVNKTIALIMMALVLISVAITFANLINKFDVISLINDTGFLQNYTNSQLHHQLMQLLQSHQNGMTIIQIFWGIWLLPFGYLVFKSQFLPKILGLLLMLGCFCYITDFLGNFIFPIDYKETIIPRLTGIPPALGEIGMLLWLSIIGVKEKK
jgi:hypothetical protein